MTRAAQWKLALCAVLWLVVLPSTFAIAQVGQSGFSTQGGGISQDAADTRYVNVSGDTMTGALQSTAVGATGSVSYTATDHCTGASIYQHQAQTPAAFKSNFCAKADGATEFIEIVASGGTGYSPVLNLVATTLNTQMYMSPLNGFQLDYGGSRALSIAGSTVTIPFTTQMSGDVKVNGCTGTVATNAVTCSANIGVITDDGTDINTGTTRASITWTNTRIASTSVVTVKACSAMDANSWIEAIAVPGSGSATLSLRNVGSANFTSAGLKLCFEVFNP